MGQLQERFVEFPFQAVYHVTTIHHWKDIAQEQLAALFANQRLHALTVTIANTPDADLPFLVMTGLIVITAFVVSAWLAWVLQAEDTAVRS